MPAKLDPLYEEAVAAVKNAGAEPADPLKIPLADARAKQQRYFAFLAADAPDVASVRDHTLNTDFGPFTVRLYTPERCARGAPDASASPVLVFTRGGGWWAGNLDSHDRTMRLLANRAGMVVCGVDYHCAPEARFPTQLTELLTAIEWLRSEGKAPGSVRGAAWSGRRPSHPQNLSRRAARVRDDKPAVRACRSRAGRCGPGGARIQRQCRKRMIVDRACAEKRMQSESGRL
jgi:hypothetical protein